MTKEQLLNYENLMRSSIFCHFDHLPFDVRLERQKRAVIQQLQIGNRQKETKGDAMNSHVSAILLGVKDMERSKRFYMEGLGWKIENDYGISVFFVPHGGSLIGFYGREGLADMVGMSPEGSGFSGIVFNYVVSSQGRVDRVLAQARTAGPTILKPAGKLKW